MPIRLGRVMRGMLNTVIELQSQTDAFSSIEIQLLSHEYRKALREMRNVKRVPATNSTTLAAIKSAKSDRVAEVQFDDL